MLSAQGWEGIRQPAAFAPQAAGSAPKVASALLLVPLCLRLQEVGAGRAQWSIVAGNVCSISTLSFF